VTCLRTAEMIKECDHHGTPGSRPIIWMIFIVAPCMLL